MNKRAALTYLMVTAVVVVILAVSLLKKKPEQIKYTQLLMGTIVEITLVGNNIELMNNAKDSAFKEIQRLESLMSHYQDASEVSRTNREAGREQVKVSQEVIEVIASAKKVSEMTDGAFDITMGVLGKAWHFTNDDKGEPLPPAKKDIEHLLPLIDYRQIIIDKESKTVKLNKQGMQINLGGIAKGYIVAKAVDEIKKKGIKKGVVHAGGDMFVFQDNEDTPWKIGIRHPRNKDAILGTITISNGAVATSGDYERFFVKDGIRYHHIMNPKTGFPVSWTQSVTIVAKDAVMADALSTAVFVMGTEKGMDLIERLPDIEGLIVDADGRIKVSSGLKEKITMERQ
ncbi:MAG: FAD:protein FMN transferase [Deltaproteobacteria bacterium]|nr:FAD:protein FMN transferase [Deltaproteobacteria bacterium]